MPTTVNVEPFRRRPSPMFSDLPLASMRPSTTSLPPRNQRPLSMAIMPGTSVGSPLTPITETTSVGWPRRRGPSPSRVIVQVSAPIAVRTSGQVRIWAMVVRAFWIVPGVSPGSLATIWPPCVATYRPMPERV